MCFFSLAAYRAGHSRMMCRGFWEPPALGVSLPSPDSMKPQWLTADRAGPARFSILGRTGDLCRSRIGQIDVVRDGSCAGERRMSKRTAIEAALRRLGPGIPAHELGAIADHAIDSPGLESAAPATAVWLSLVDYVRHVLTEDDALLAARHAQASAGCFVTAEINDRLAAWGVRRRLEPGA